MTEYKSDYGVAIFTVFRVLGCLLIIPVVLILAWGFIYWAARIIWHMVKPYVY